MAAGAGESSTSSRTQLILWFVPAVLFAAAAYELAVLLWGSYGSASGAGIRSEETVAGIAYLTMFAGVVIAAVHALRPLARGLSRFVPQRPPRS